MTVLYIAGPMTGHPEDNSPAFMDAERALIAVGFHVVNPVHLWPDPENDGASYRDRMRLDIYEMLRCDGVAQLPGWESSRGAILECHVARELGLHVQEVNIWCSLPIAGEPPCASL